MQPWLERFAGVVFARSSDTAHDLKTPVNVAVLNLELLRMRLRKLAASDDEKIEGYTRAIDQELRRLASIFDAFFVYSVPPSGKEPPSLVDVERIVREECAAREISFDARGAGSIQAHEARIRTLVRLLLEGSSRLLGESKAWFEGREHVLSVRIVGIGALQEIELGKLFKFYYTDASGNPELSLATSRLIAETYGGVLTASTQDGRTVIELVFQGDT